MHKLIDYICNELMEYEDKISKEGQLSMQDLQVIDTLAHTKKNLLKAEEMEQGAGSYRGSYGMGSYGSMAYDDGSYGSYARGRGSGARRDSMGRYASDGYSREAAYETENKRMKERMKQIISDTPDERTRRMLSELVSEF